jgi:hypothetical protein
MVSSDTRVKLWRSCRQLIRRRGGGFGRPRNPRPSHLNIQENHDEARSAQDDEDYQGRWAGEVSTPLGLRRFKANAEAWRRKLERELVSGPPVGAHRERIVLWVRNLGSREAWFAARLEHTIATKRLLVEFLNGEKSTNTEKSTAASKSRPVVEEEASPIEDVLPTEGILPTEDGEDL